jgi:hypothetical protein
MGQYLATKAKELGRDLTPADVRQATSEYQQAAHPPTPITPYQQAELGMQRERLGFERQKAAQAQTDVTELTPEGVDAAALMFSKTGQLPALGMGDKTTRKQIINRAAQLTPGLDIASAKADFGANTATLTQLEKQRAAIGAFEQTAIKNIDVFLETAGKVVDTGSPLANTLFRQATASSSAVRIRRRTMRPDRSPSMKSPRSRATRISPVRSPMPRAMKSKPSIRTMPRSSKASR